LAAAGAAKARFGRWLSQSGPYAFLISWARSVQASISLAAMVGVCFGAASNFVTRIDFETICQIADAPGWTGKNRWKIAHERQVRRF
jgi:hypothetical protein